MSTRCTAATVGSRAEVNLWTSWTGQQLQDKKHDEVFDGVIFKPALFKSSFAPSGRLLACCLFFMTSAVSGDLASGKNSHLLHGLVVSASV